MPFRLLLFAHSDRGSELAPQTCLRARYRGSDGLRGHARKGRESLFTCVRLRRSVRAGGLVPPAEAPRSPPSGPRRLNGREGSAGRVFEVVALSVDVPRSLAARAARDDPPGHRHRRYPLREAHHRASAPDGRPASSPWPKSFPISWTAPSAPPGPWSMTGLFPRERMIGQTGKTVSPDLYLALGISGSPHHVAGIPGSQRVCLGQYRSQGPDFQCFRRRVCRRPR